MGIIAHFGFCLQRGFTLDFLEAQPTGGVWTSLKKFEFFISSEARNVDISKEN